ncbi:MAG: hypothetical protein GY888_08320, partial [Planctomycetaceae bacterium]|nr:hypothetical protein [Planctomycetaceae bacterium]
AMPGGGNSLLSLLLPADATFGVHLGTDGLVEGSVFAMQAFFDSLIKGAIDDNQEVLNAVLDKVADKLETTHRDSQLAQILLEDSGDPETVVINRAWLINRLLGGEGVPGIFSTKFDIAPSADDLIDYSKAKTVAAGLLTEMLALGPLVLVDEKVPVQIQEGSFEYKDLDDVWLRDAEGNIVEDPDGNPQVIDGAVVNLDGTPFKVFRENDWAGELALDSLDLPDEVESQVINIIQRFEERLTALRDERLDDLPDPDEADTDEEKRARELLEHRLESDFQLSTAGAKLQVAFALMMGRTVFNAIEASFNTFFYIIDPELKIEGQVQPTILGFPLGEPRERVAVHLKKDLLQFEATFSILEKLLYGTFSSFVAPQFLPVSETLKARFAVHPENLLRDLALGKPPQLNLMTDPWEAVLAGELQVFGFKVSDVAGVLLPPESGNLHPGAIPPPGPALPEVRFDSNDDGSDDVIILRDPNLLDFEIVDNQYKVAGGQLWDHGGLILDGRFYLPKLLTDPTTVLTEAQAKIDDDADLLTVVKQLPALFDGLTEPVEVGNLQIYLPNLFHEVQEYLIDQGELLVEDVANGEVVGEKIAAFLVDLEGSTSAELEELRQNLKTQASYAYLEGDYDFPLLGMEIADGSIQAVEDHFEITTSNTFLGIETTFEIDFNTAAGDSFDDRPINGVLNGVYDAPEPFTDGPATDPNNRIGLYDGPVTDPNNQIEYDPGEAFVDTNFNGQWDAGDVLTTDHNENGQYDAGLPPINGELPIDPHESTGRDSFETFPEPLRPPQAIQPPPQDRRA